MHWKGSVNGKSYSWNHKGFYLRVEVYSTYKYLIHKDGKITDFFYFSLAPDKILDFWYLQELKPSQSEKCFRIFWKARNPTNHNYAFIFNLNGLFNGRLWTDCYTIPSPSTLPTHGLLKVKPLLSDSLLSVNCIFPNSLCETKC